ncbi:hypothetical protein [Pseudorhodoplanes sinuspersici]|uniref:hypothetical protein n=1 Tax=Pseudorhodoplanes sinuspersici TaxID=1235591 RepID=UPI001600D35D|nr:hypothetical protein [Pseudorhodoplanes sinuspersici]
MHKIVRNAATLSLLLCLFASSAQAQSEGAPKFAFVRELQKAVRADNRTWLADHIQYPLRHHGRIATIIRNRSDFVRNYATIVSDKLRAAILAQEPDKVFENWQGVMVGDGSHNMWLRQSGEGDNLRYEIVTINDMNDTP